MIKANTISKSDVSALSYTTVAKISTNWSLVCVVNPATASAFYEVRDENNCIVEVANDADTAMYRFYLKTAYHISGNQVVYFEICEELARFEINSGKKFLDLQARPGENVFIYIVTIESEDDLMCSEFNDINSAIDFYNTVQ
jgi:hypothetical protein